MLFHLCRQVWCVSRGWSWSWRYFRNLSWSCRNYVLVGCWLLTTPPYVMGWLSLGKVLSDPPQPINLIDECGYWKNYHWQGEQRCPTVTLSTKNPTGSFLESNSLFRGGIRAFRIISLWFVSLWTHSAEENKISTSQWYFSKRCHVYLTVT